MKLTFDKQVDLAQLSQQLITKVPTLINKNTLGENIANFLVEKTDNGFSIILLGEPSAEIVQQIEIAVAAHQDIFVSPVQDYTADAINIGFTPTPESSILDAINLQTAMEQVVAHVTDLQSQVTMLRAAQKQPNVYDTFNNLLGFSLNLHVPTNYQGSKWVEQVGDWSIQSNQAASNGTAGSLTWIESKIGISCIVECDVTIADVAVPQGILFRYISPTQHWRVCYSKSSGKIIIYEIAGSAVSSRTTANLTLVVGQTYKFRVVLDNANISFYLNDELKLSWSATANMEATKHGLYCSSSTGTRFKNFKVIAI